MKGSFGMDSRLIMAPMHAQKLSVAFTLNPKFGSPS
jgi:hypothetical protein